MRTRCQDLNNDYYGGRGISVDPRWDDFLNFLSDMGERPSPKHSIERIDNDKGYTPDNCKWATRTEQCNNRRSNHWLVTPKGRMTMTQAATAFGLARDTLKQRLMAYGWDLERALTEPVRQNQRPS